MDKNPTRSHPKFVASAFDRGRFVRNALTELVRFLRADVPVSAEGGGDLSDWILRLHGFTKDESKPMGYAQPHYDAETIDQVAAVIAKIASPNLDPGAIVKKIEASEKISLEVTRTLKQIPNATLKDVDAAITNKSPALFEAWELPWEFYSQFGLSAATTRQMLRSFRALAVCLELHKSHVVCLIARSIKSDRQAVLDLVKVDKMFVHDSCTARVIKSATMNNDQAFLGQLIRAQKYRFRLTMRAALHVYFNFIFEVELSGFTADTTLHELWRMLDPHGKNYTRLEAFERDYQRRHADFQRLLEEALNEIGTS